MRKPVALSVVFAACAVAPAFGDYWTQYQSRPDAPYPEDQGWQRIVAPGYGGAQRSIDEGGNLVLDSLASRGIVDGYQMMRAGMIHAESAHPFLMEFRMKVDYADSPDESVGIWSDDRWSTAFAIDTGHIYSLDEWPMSAAFDPGWHVFRITSAEMRTYVLSIDGVDAMSGSFTYNAYEQPSVVNWGDGAQGPLSFSRWGYVGFGIVPEPLSVLSMPLGLIMILRASRRG
jgi:hypothetical protein